MEKHEDGEEAQTTSVGTSSGGIKTKPVNAADAERDVRDRKRIEVIIHAWRLEVSRKRSGAHQPFSDQSALNRAALHGVEARVHLLCHSLCAVGNGREGENGKTGGLAGVQLICFVKSFMTRVA